MHISQLDNFMNNILKYSFDDEPVINFYYDLINKRLEIGFSGYYENQDLIDKPCIFTIKNWKDSSCKVGDEEKRYPINSQLGIINMVLHMKYQNNKLKILVNTLDNRYIELCFEQPQLSLKS